MASPTGVVPVVLTVTADQAGKRLDRALADVAPPGLSRSRLAALIAEGALTDAAGQTVTDIRQKAQGGSVYHLNAPAPVNAELRPEAIPLDILFEDEHVIVVNKTAGMVVHPAPGAPSGTLVNALLAHCGDSLAGIGGERRPGIVHRIDRFTSGALVCAKTERAHAGLSAQFAEHSIDRRYLALCWGAPTRSDPRFAGLEMVAFDESGWLSIDAPIGRHQTDRTKMAVRRDGRRALTRVRIVEAFGLPHSPFASLIECRLETGRTHQIRVHTLQIGHPLIGDPVYGRPRLPPKNATDEDLRSALAAFPRQALHAERLGFVHPATREKLTFSAPLPPDLNEILTHLRRNT